jgi:hypothetical protein
MVNNSRSQFRTSLLYGCLSKFLFVLASGNHNYKIEEGRQCNSNTRASIPRADVAHFMLAALQTDIYDRKAIAIASL